MAGPWEKYQQQAAPQQAPAGPWAKYQQAAPSTAPTTAETAGQRSQRVMPSQQAALADASRPPSRGDILAGQGVGFEEAPRRAQFRFGLGASAAETPEQQIELARRALGDPNVELQFDEGTGQVLFRPQGSEQFQTFNKPGPSMGDFHRFAPEAGVLGAGVGGGIAGGMAGGVIGPGTGVAGVVTGEGGGEAIGEAIRLTKAAEQGLIDLTPDEIIQQATRRGLGAAAATAVGGAMGATLRQVLARRWGLDADVLEAMGNRPVSELTQRSEQVQRGVQRETGQRLPLTLGQQTRVPEILRAEEAAPRLREPGQLLGNIRERQDAIIGDLSDQTFGPRATPTDRRELGQGGLAEGRRRAESVEDALSTTEETAFGRAVPPESAAGTLRGQIEEGREQVFAPLKQQFDELQAEQGIQIDLSPVRAEAARLKSDEGQEILRSVSLHQQSPLLREAERAGTDVVDDELVNVPQSLGDVQRALRDIRRELRRPGMADEPQRQRILQRLESSLVNARDEGLPTEARAAVHALEEQYAQGVQQLNRDVVGRFMETDPRTGVPKLSGEASMQALLRSPDEAERFVDALHSLPNGDVAHVTMQNGVMGMLQERFQDAATGHIDPGRLRGFLRNRSNREALKVLFADRPEVVRSLGDAETMARRLNEINQSLETARGRMDKALGIPTADPAELATKFMNEADPRSARLARRLLPEAQREQFDRVLSTSMRDRMVDSQGNLDAGKINAFLESDRANVATAIFGGRYNRQLEVLRDAIETTSQRAGPGASEDLAQAFKRDVNGLQGLLRFARVPFAPLSVRGRAFTASMGLLQEQSRKRLAEILAHPEELNELAKLANLSPAGRRAELIMGRLGLGGAHAAMEQLSQGEENTEAENGARNPTQ